MIRIILVLSSFILGIVTTNAQQTTGQILDSESNESIPFATIKFGEADLISNENGHFSITSETDSDLVTISFIGYKSQSVTVGYIKQNKIIKLVQGSYDIGGVYISNEKPEPNEIMKLIQENYKSNYQNITNYTTKSFNRKSNVFSPTTLNVKITKSTDFSKKELKEFNDELNKFTSSLLSDSPKQFTDKLVNYSLFTKKTEDKNSVNAKIQVIKAVKLKDKNRSTDTDDLQNSALQLLFKHIDTTKYYRLKSGIFGSGDSIHFQNKRVNIFTKSTPKKDKNLNDTKHEIFLATYESSFMSYPDMNFVKETNLYDYTFVEATYLDNDLVYIIDFKPKKRKGLYKGRLYVNKSDYAILRADYDLAEGKKLYGINLKLILGVKTAENVSRGTIVYKKHSYKDKGYYLYYSSKEFGQYFYINRPLKLIEITKNKKERDKIAFDIKIEGTQLERKEYLCLSISSIKENDFNAIQEKEFDYEIHSKYNPNTWKGYNIIEPLEEMKKFKVIE